MSCAHRLCFANFSNMLRGQNIVVMLSVQFAIERNVVTKCLERIFTAIRYLARQGLPFEAIQNLIQASDSFYIYVQVTRNIYNCGYKGRQRGLPKIHRKR